MANVCYAVLRASWIIIANLKHVERGTTLPVRLMVKVNCFGPLAKL